MKKTGYNWFEGEVVEEGNADDTDDNNDDDYDEMENLVGNVLGDNDNEEDEDYDTVADNNINSEDKGGVAK